jgi:hypothetical protein
MFSENDEEKKLVMKKDEKTNNLNDITNYLKIVLAHRLYQRAMCRFKFARYVVA